MTIKLKTEELRMEMLNGFDAYTEAYKQMSEYEGKIIDEIGLEKVNAAILDVQEKFAHIWPVLNFIQIYHQFSTNAFTSHKQFIDSLKQAGAIEEQKV